MLYYILTLILGVILDTTIVPKPYRRKMRFWFVIWLYVFLCFGYMTGSDWRIYELDFYNMNTISDVRWSGEVLFGYLFLLLHRIIGDYWLSVGILKILYLYTLIRVTKRLSEFWLSVVVLMMPLSLLFILIDNPLRFMTALILVHVGMEMCLKQKTKLAISLMFFSFFFHNASIFFIILIPAILYAERLSSWNKIYLLVVYLVLTGISSYPALIEAFRRWIVFSIRSYNEGMSTYNTYEVTSNVFLFSIGSLFELVIMGVVLFTRDTISQKNENGKLIFGMTVAYLMLARILHVIPTGFRLVIPLGIFYTVYMIYLIKARNIFRWLFIVYIAASFPRYLWNTYKFIPYSNSIPYIITGHLDYYERSMYNISDFKNRTQEDVYIMITP